MDRKYFKKEKKQMNLSMKVLLSFIFIAAVIVIMSAASAQIAPPDVTKDASPTDINVKGTGFNEITTITIEVTGAGGTSTTTVPMEIVFAIDSSGSMMTNDPSNLRITAAQAFVDMMNSAVDLGGVVSWDDNIDFTYGLSSNFVTLKNQIGNVDSSGSTNLNVGLNAAINMLNPPDPAKAEAIIFLTDGQGTYTYDPGNPVHQAVLNGYAIYSIGLGASHNPAPLIDMATATGGQYFNAPTAANLQAIFNAIFTQIVISTIPHYVDVTEVTQACIVDEGSFNIMPDSISTVGGITTIIWNNIGLLSGDGDPDLSADEVVNLTFEAKSDCCQQNQTVDVYGDAKVDYDDNNGVYAGTVLIPQEYINVDCDTTPPETTKTHGPCVFYDPSIGIWYMKPCNPIYLYARDYGPVATGVQFLYYEVWWDIDCDGIYDVIKFSNVVFDNDPDDLNPIPGEIDVEIHIDQECCHMLYWYAVDQWGNQEQPHEQHYRLDGTPPTITKTHPDPCYIPISPTEGMISIGSDIVLQAVDGGIPPCIAGVSAIYWGFELDGIWHPIDITDNYYGNMVGYFKDGKWWYYYSQPIEFHETCKHVLEYWAIDNVCNIGPTHTQTYWVNICRQLVEVDDDFHPALPDWLHTKFVDKQMALDWLGPYGTALMYDGYYYGDFVIDDVPCCDNTGITQMGEYGCYPANDPAIIHGSETIKVDDVTIKYMEYDPNPDGSIIIDPGVSGITLRCNKFRKDCIDDAVGVKSLSNAMVNAELNWWGKPDGPDGGLMDDGTLSDGLGVKVYGNVDVEPWLGVNAEASASTITAVTGELILFSSDGTWAYTYGECCQNAEPLPIDYLWEFDDGAYSMEENPAHTYDAPGIYHVILEIRSYDSRLWGEFMFDWAYLTIHVTAPGSPLAANADGQDLGGYETTVDEEIQLYGIATGGTQPYTYSWDLGDGTSSDEQNPVHVYNSEGIYTVTLTITDSVGDTASDTAEVTVYGSDEITVSIDAESNGIAGDNMVFNSVVKGGTEPYIYEWDFGDETPINNEANPVHIFENPGTYTVKITVTDAIGKSDDATTTVDIQEESGSAKIKQVTGGLGVKATIAAGNTDCDWTINVDGKYVFSGGETSGTIPANTENTVKLPQAFALGKVTITVTANAIQKDYTAFAIGPFFLKLEEA